MKISLSLLSLLCSLSIYGPMAIANDDKASVDFDELFGKNRVTACEMSLTSGKTTLISSGRDSDTLPKYIEYVQSLTKQNGLMQKLGMKLPPHVFLFVPGQLAGVLAAMNMVPMGHYYDGARVAQGQSSISGILEMVFPGGQHSFYRDDLNAPGQIAVINHAYLGHAWFAVHGKYSQVRTAEAISDSYKLYEMIEHAYLQNDPQEVAEWYSFLMSMQWDQDTIKGVEESPELFRKFTAENRLKENRNRLFQVPRTRNVLPFLVSQLSQELPQWKLDIARQFEKLQRYIPGAINTKIMNEGWAVLMEELAPLHAELGNDFVHFQEYCCLMRGVGTSTGSLQYDLQNPYYMGIEGWRILREKFHLRPDMFNKTLLEKDRAFIEWATKEVINKMDDRDFLSYAFTDKWILRKNLTLTKNLGFWDPLGREVSGDPNQFDPPGIIENVSKDPSKIRRALVRNKEDSILSTPTPATRPLREQGGVVELEMVDGLGKFQPLKSRSMVAKLWTMSRIAQKPVAMESTYITIKQTMITEGGWAWWLKQWVDDLYTRAGESPEFWRIHTIVHPEGRVEVRKVFRGDKQTGPDSVEDPDKYNIAPPQNRQFEHWPMITDRFQGFLDEFLVDWYADADFHEVVARVPRLGQNDLLKSWTTTSASVAEFAASLSDGISTEVFDHSPTVPRALHEYRKKVSARLTPALKKALFGKGRATTRNGNLRVRVLPQIPRFEYNTTMDGKKLHKDKVFPENHGFGDWKPKAKNFATQNIRANLVTDLMAIGKVSPAVLTRVSEALSEPQISSQNLLKLMRSVAPPRSLQTKSAKSIETAIDTEKDLDDEDLNINSDPNGEGSVHWGEGEDPRGKPKPNEDGEPSDQEEGDEPGGNQNGGEANEPEYVDVPPDIWGRMLAEEIELPNTRPLDDEDNRRTKVLGKKARRKAGIAKPELISREAFKLGIANLQEEAGLDHPDDLLDALTEDPQSVHASGFRLLREQDWWVKGTRYKPNPDIKAVVYVVVDLSGSMSAWFSTVKRMSADLQALLRAKYPQVEMRFVPFDGNAIVLDDVDKLLRISLGGGTSYGQAFKATRDHMDKNFPYVEWDRYVVIQGDLIDSPQGEDWSSFEQMHRRAQYTGVIQTGGWPGWGGYTDKFLELKAQDEFFGFEEVQNPGDYAPIIYRALFKNPPKN